MKPPVPGLRPLWNKSNHVAKVDLRIAAGASVAADDAVAAQLLLTGDFAEGAAPAVEAPVDVVEAATEGAPPVEVVVEPVKAPAAKKAAPRKRA